MVAGIVLVVPKLINLLRKETFQNKLKKDNNSMNKLKINTYYWIFLNLLLSICAVYLSLKCKKTNFVDSLLAFAYPFFYIPYRIIKKC
jgi:hypothetical protein